MTTKPTVLFICKHNAGRSQLGAALLELAAPDRYTATSAGISPAEETQSISRSSQASSHSRTMQRSWRPASRACAAAESTSSPTTARTTAWTPASSTRSPAGAARCGPGAGRARRCAVVVMDPFSRAPRTS